MSTIQSASTPPPSPPMAKIAILIGCVITRPSEGVLGAALGLAALEPADHARAHALAEAVPARRVADDLRLVEGGAQHRGMRDIAAVAAAHAALEHGGDRVGAQRIGV